MTKRSFHRYMLMHLAVFVLCSQISAFSVQNSGFPFITSISPDEYDGHVQNWGFTTDHDGVLYIANLSGVIRYDGVRRHQIDIPNLRVMSIASDADGRVYVGGLEELGFIATSASSVASETGRRYHSLTSLIPDSISFGNVWNIVAGDQGVVFQTNSHLFRFDGEKMTVYPAEHRFTGLFVMDGEVYTRDAYLGIRRVGNERMKSWEDGDFFAEITFQSFLEAGDLTLFCSFYECFSYENGGFKPFENEASGYLRENYIDEVLALSDSTIMVATRNGGVVRLDADGRMLQVFDEKNGIPSNTVYGLYEDPTGSVWVATVNGIARIDVSLPFRRYDERHGITESLNRMTIRDDTLFISASTGVYRISRDGDVRFYDGMTFCTHFLQHAGELYVTCTGSVFRYDEHGFRRMSSEHFANVLEVYDDTILVAARQSQLSLVEFGNAEKNIRYQLDDIDVIPNSVKVCSNDNIWVGTESRGVYKVQLNYERGEYAGHSVTRYLDDLQNPGDDKRVYVTRLDDEPAFLTWGRGIQRFDYEKDTLVAMTRFGELFSNHDRQIFWAEEDYRGNVWFRSGMANQAALRQSDGSYRQYTSVLNRLDDRQINAIYPDENGFVWYVTDRGLVRYDPDHRFDPSFAFHTGIGEVRVRGDSLVSDGPNTEPLVLEYRDNELRLTYAAASYHAPGRTQYRVKLEGFDSDWSVWSDEVQKDYTNIPEGSYRFVVEARNVYGEMQASMPFHLDILPPWYRTWWAYVLYAVLAVSLLYAGYRIRLNQILRVHRIRNSIAADLHDEISATLSSISFFAKAIDNKKMQGDKSRFVQLISQSAGEAKEKISDIVWAINPEHDDWKSFLSKCRRHASDLFESNDMEYRLEIKENIPGKLDMQLRQNLWMIYKEIITNAVRHSGASFVSVQLSYTGRVLKLVVEDNGKGFDENVVVKGSGVDNIRRRAGSAGGNIQLDSQPGKGTRWELTLRV